MAITKGAKKAHRSSLKKRVFNVRRQKAMRSAVKEVRTALVGGDAAKAASGMAAAYQAIDKAAKRGVIKQNTAARRKSRLALALAKAGK